MRTEILWNIASLAVIAVAGLALNFSIGRLYDAATLGSFNQVLAVFLVLGQIAVGGFCLSVLAALPPCRNDRAESSRLITAALAVTGLAACPVALATWVLAPSAGAALFDSPAVGEGLRWVAIGLVFFAFNKILLFAVNGLGDLRAFAAGQAGRFVLLIGGFAVLYGVGAGGAELPAILTAAEAVLFVGLALYLIRRVGVARPRELRPWIAHHLRFGRQAFWNGFLLDLNTKIDILLLGVFLPDRAVGVYAFASNLAEGLAQIPWIGQAVLNPRISDILRRRDQAYLSRLVRWSCLFGIGGMAVIGVGAALAFPFAADLLTQDPVYRDGLAVFAILVGGVVVTAGHVPFALILNQAGAPQAHRRLLGVTVALTTVFTLVLVPLWGITGAAVAVTLSMMASILLLRRSVRGVLGLTL